MKRQKPKANFVRVLSGNPGKRTIKKSVADIHEKEELCIDFPNWYPKKARQYVNSLLPGLKHHGLKQIDTSALLALGMCWFRLDLAEAMLLKEGLALEGYRGSKVKHPVHSILRNAEQQFLRWCQEFGLSPLARNRLPVAAEKVEDKFTKYLKRMNNNLPIDKTLTKRL